MSSPLFGIIPTGQPVITEPSSCLSDSSFLYRLSSTKAFSHIVVFMLPGITLPPETATAIYLGTAEGVQSATTAGHEPAFKFLGGIGPGKESAVFKVGGSSAPLSTTLVLGISIESATSVAARIQEISGTATRRNLNSGVPEPAHPSSSLSVATDNVNRVALAQKIIQSAFIFLSSFSGSGGPGQIEVVPLKAFEEWWQKFEGRLRSDPTFLDGPVN